MRKYDRQDIYLDDLLGQMNAEELKAFYSEEESSEDSLVHIKISSAKSKHKAPKTFCAKNPTQMSRKCRSEDVQVKENKKKKSSPQILHHRRLSAIKIMIQVGEDDMNDVFNVTMSETINLRKIENNPPRIVLINNTITKCNGCGRNFKAEDRKSLTIWCSGSMHGRLGEMTEGKKLPPSPSLPITVPGIWHMYRCRGRGYYQKIYTVSHFMPSVSP